MTKNINILLVEDNPGYVLLVQNMLSKATESNYKLIHASQLSQGFKYLENGEIDIVLLDLSLPGSKGIDTFLSVHKQFPFIPTVVLTSLDNESTAIKIVKEGAQDYLVKGKTDSVRLISSIQFAIERQKKEKVHDGSEKIFLQKELENLNLTNKEKEVLSLIAEGKSNEEIAKILFVSISTIKNHIGKIFAKLRISNRSQATAIAIKAGLVNFKSENND